MTDGGLAAGAAADAHGGVEEAGKDIVAAAGGDCRRESGAHLPQDLRLANDEGVETGRDAEEVLGRFGAGVMVEDRPVWPRPVPGRREGADDRRAVDPGLRAGEVNLGAVAGGEDGRRAKGGGEAAQGRRQVLRPQGKALADANGRRPVADAGDGYLEGVVALGPDEAQGGVEGRLADPIW